MESDFVNEYLTLKLQKEWGLTTEQFNAEPTEKIIKLIQIQQAESRGQNKRNN